MKTKLLQAAALAILLGPCGASAARAEDGPSAKSGPECYSFMVRHSYPPSEEQYRGGTITFPWGDGTEATYNRNFINHLKETGVWGLTLEGKFIQKSADAEDPSGKKHWRVSDTLVNSQGLPVKDNTVATNRLDLFPLGSYVTVGDSKPLLVNDSADYDPDKNEVIIWSPDGEDADDVAVCKAKK
jgi:hypothetical protein